MEVKYKNNIIEIPAPKVTKTGSTKFDRFLCTCEQCHIKFANKTYGLRRFCDDCRDARRKKWKTGTKESRERYAKLRADIRATTKTQKKEVI